MTTLVWFRDDLRLADHPALASAAEDPDGVVAIYVLDEESPGIRPLGGASRWWLHHSLTSLRASLDALGVPLILRRGRAEHVIAQLIDQSDITRVVWNRRYGAARDIDARLKRSLRDDGVTVESFPGNVLHEPWTITTGAGGPYRRYTPYWRAVLAAPHPLSPMPAPDRLKAASKQPSSDRLDDWGLLPTGPDWSGGLVEAWEPGEHSALERLENFLDGHVHDYERQRDRPATEGTSRLSPHLRWGEVSPRTIWASARRGGRRHTETFLGEIGWREFATHTLFHAPDLAERNLDTRFDRFRWADADGDVLGAWQRGETGIPLVDAGMRQLWRTGWMHNRVRMVTASFLTKNLLIDWRVGEHWFWDTLVDADEANNPFNWQWVAGCGADAAPYFRIFNPLLQQQKFDPDGTYVDRWAPDSIERTPIVDLGFTRQRALAEFDRIR